jgi:hypothetical protein
VRILSRARRVASRLESSRSESRLQEEREGGQGVSVEV